MDNLQLIGFERTPGEATKYLNYSSRLKKMMAKIDHLIETLQANIPGMVENLLEQYVQEEEDFCESLRIKQQELLDPVTTETHCSNRMTTKDGRTQKITNRKCLT